MGATTKSGAHKIISFEQGFHGRTLATMSASGKPAWESLFEPKVPGFIKLPFNQLSAVENAIDEQTVAIMLEPVQGEAGVIPAQAEFVQGLQKICKQQNVLLIFDEVQTGVGRTGKLFCYQHFDVQPDIMTLGKGLGGGVPLSALLSSRQASCFEYGEQGGTFNGNPLMTAAGLAIVKAVNESGFLAQVVERGAYLRRQLNALSRQHGLGEVRGMGLLLALDTKHRHAGDIMHQAFANGLLVNAPRPDSLRFMPALNITHVEIDEMIRILRDCIHNQASV